MGGLRGACSALSGLLFRSSFPVSFTVGNCERIFGLFANVAGVSPDWLTGSYSFRLIVLQGKTGTGDKVTSRIGARDGRGDIVGAMGGDIGQGGGVGCLAFTSKLCYCVTYDRSPQNSAATSFRYLFGAKRCYFVF